MTETVLRHDIRDFAAAVRAHLDDLPADEVDDLLDGLEADLSDQADEAGDAFALPDAAAYAIELRTAAGLPGRVACSHRSWWRTLGADGRARVADALGAVRSNRAGAWLLDTLVALRPLWWIVRAAVVFVLIVPFVPPMSEQSIDLLGRILAPTLNLPTLLLFAGLVLLSIQWGRRGHRSAPWLRALGGVVSVIAAFAAPYVIVAGVADVQAARSHVRSAGYQSFVPGLAVDGQRVRNVFAYDAEGTPIEAVQLFDQDGTPLTTVSGVAQVSRDWDDYFYRGGGPVPVPVVDPGRAPVWNVFPLAQIPAGSETGEARDRMRAVDAPFPYAQVPAIPGHTSSDASVAAEPAPTESPAP